VTSGPDRPLHFGIHAAGQTLGGGITVVRNLVPAMARARPAHRFTLFTSMDELARSEFPANVRVDHRPELAGLARRTLWDQLQLPGILRREAIDAVLLFNGFSVFASRVPQVSVWQNPNMLSPEDVPRPLSLKLYIDLQRFMQSVSLRKATCNVFLTQHSLDMAARIWPMERHPHRVIHSGIDPARVATVPAPDETPDSERENVALAVGHTYYHKNYARLIEAMMHYVDTWDDDLRVVVLGGPYEPDHHRELERRVRELGLSERFEMPGARPSEEVLAWYSRARLYVTVSLLETFGLPILEAMANGLPVVASRATCHPEVAGPAARYCDPEDPADIARALHEVSTDRELRNELRRRGREQVAAFSWERAGVAYVEELERAAFSSALQADP
jgi:glycosyltransferase involved in cell wall biosynthesis